MRIYRKSKVRAWMIEDKVIEDTPIKVIRFMEKRDDEMGTKISSEYDKNDREDHQRQRRSRFLSK